MIKSEYDYIAGVALAFRNSRIAMEKISKEPDPEKRELLYLREVSAQDRTIGSLKRNSGNQTNAI